MMKHHLRQIKEPLQSIKDTVAHGDELAVRKEELYLPKSTQQAVENNLRHGISNSASGGLKSVPFSGKE
eukprot:12937313-Prorocentrum_lima.AAC.1